MDKTISPSKSAIQYGVLFGIIMILELVISFVFNVNPVNNRGYGIAMNLLNFVLLPVALIVIGCNNYKNKFNSGFIKYGECLKIGVTICVVAAVIYAIFSVIFNMIFPEFANSILRLTKEALLQQNPNMPKEQLEMAVSMTEKMMSPVFAIPITIIMYAFIGLIYSLIIGLVVKKERPNSH